MQAPDWASIEYGGRWKMLHYFAAKFFAPVLISSYEYPTNSYNVFLVNDLTTVRLSDGLCLFVLYSSVKL